MEMTFPPLGRNQQTALMQPDHRALLATAIARQANGRTARVVLAAKRHGTRKPSWSADIVEQRIQYFSAHEKNQFADDQRPTGAFFPIERTVFADELNSEERVYQDASNNIKAHADKTDAAEHQQNHVGHGTLRTI